MNVILKLGKIANAENLDTSRFAWKKSKVY